MSYRIFKLVAIGWLAMLSACGGGCTEDGRESGTEADSMETVTVIDAMGREVVVRRNPRRVICSGPGCLRLLCYLQAQDRAVAVDDMEGRRQRFDARPYAMASPELAELPVFGEFRGHDNPELIVALDPAPQVIFKTYANMGMDPQELQRKTGIPVVVLDYGNLTGSRKPALYHSLRTMGAVLERGERAEEVVAFLEEVMADLEARTTDVPDSAKVSCYVGGIAYRGPHGLQSTEPSYPPLALTGARNLASAVGGEGQEHADVAKEQIVAWDPEVLFVDASTLQSDPQASALWQLRNDPAYSDLSALREGRVYGLLPYNWYTKNFGSILADAYYVGTVLYPDRFADVDPEAMADSIYAFLVGEPVFGDLSAAFEDRVFRRLDI
ncbi:MAG: iron ABC transporter substrate-binding protein [Candidatus Fermentibacteraceae bacterium]